MLRKQQQSALATGPREIPRHTYVLRRAVGLDLHDAPPDVAEGYLTQADNIIIVGNRPRVRPGKVAILGSAFANPVYLLTEYVVGGVSKVLATQGGKLYAITPPSNPGVGSATVVEITYSGGASTTVVSAKAVADSILNQTTQVIVVVDGSNNPPLYINPATNLVAAAGGLNGPTVKLPTALTNILLDGFTSTTGWAADTLTSASTNQVVNSAFAGGSVPSGSADYSVMPGWTPTGVSVDYYLNPAGVTGVFEDCDTPGDTITSTAYIANFTETLDTSRYATAFYMAYDAFNTDEQSRGSIISGVIVYDAGGNELGRQSKERAIPDAGLQVATFRDVFSFGDLGTPIAKYKVFITNGQGNQLGTVDAIYLNNIQSYPVTPPAAFAATSAGLSVTFAETVPNTPEIYLNGAHLRYTFPATLDLTRTETLVIGLGTNSARLSGLQFYLRLEQSGMSTWYSTNPATVDSATGFATVDITTASIPDAVRAACAKMEIVFTSDIVYTGTGTLFLGPMLGAGNLTSDGFSSYIYVYTEINSLGDVTYSRIIESNPSPLSDALTPTETQATAILTLPSSPVNGTSDAFKVYRIGGVYDDGVGRSLFPFSAELWSTNDLTGSAAKNKYVSWNHTAHTLTDNTPDSFLLNSSDLLDYGHDPPPSGAQAVCAWQKRLCLGVGSKLYVSSLTDADGNAALYFPRANLVSDPNAPLKGFFTGTGTGQPIVALLAYGTNLIIDKGPHDGVYLGFGYDVRNFAVQSYLLKSGVGSVAPGCLLVVRNHAWLLGPDGWYQFNADTSDPTSLAIDRLLSPALAGGSPLNAAAYAGSRAVYHARRLLHFAPSVAGDTTNTVTHVWDSRQGGWTNWTISATSGVSLSSAADTGACFIGGYDGQVYQLTGAADIATPGGSPSAIAWAVATRAVGQEGGGEAFYREKRVTRVFGEILTEDASGGTIAIGTRFQGSSWTPSYTLLPGAAGAGVTTSARRTAPQWVRGRNLEIVVSGSSTALTEIAALGIEIAEGRLK